MATQAQIDWDKAMNYTIGKHGDLKNFWKTNQFTKRQTTNLTKVKKS